MKQKYVESFDYFRAFSIFFIALGHSLTYKFQSEYPFLTNLVKGGGTLFFVFISGYLFCLLLPKYDSYSSFILTKLKKLLTPYVIYSIPLIIFAGIKADSIFYDTDFGISQSLYPLLSLITGAHMTGYWYVPAIFLFFLVTFPYLKIYSASSQEHRYSVIALLCLVSIFIHRPIGNFNPIHASLYISSFFFIGMSFFIDREKILNNINRKLIVICVSIAFIAINFHQSYTFNHIGNYHKEIFDYNGIDWTFLKFLLITPLAFIFFECYCQKASKVMKHIASVSFFIYFIHPVVISALNITGVRDFIEIHFGSFITSISTMVVAILSCLVIHGLTVKVTKRQRASILGW